MAKITEPPKLSHVAPVWFHKWVEENRQWMIDNRVIEGLNTAVSDSPAGGKRIDALVPRPAAIKRGPFEVYLYDQDGQLNIEANSTIITSDNWNGFQSITDLTSPFTPEQNDKVWLEVNFDTAGAVSSCLRKHGAVGWTEWPVFFTGGGRNEEDNEWFVQKWFQLIGYFVDAEDWETSLAFFDSGNVRQKFIQCTTTNLMVAIQCSNGEEKKLIHSLVPWSGAFTA